MNAMLQDRTYQVGALANRNSHEVFCFTVGAEALIGAELCVVHDDMSRATELLHVAVRSAQANPQPDGHVLVCHEAYQWRTFHLTWTMGFDTTPMERQCREMQLLPAKVRQLLRAVDPTAASGLVFPGEPGCPKAHYRMQSIERFFSRARRAS
jgi:hypothetical protein